MRRPSRYREALLLAVIVMSFCPLPVWGDPGSGVNSETSPNASDQVILTEYREIRRTARTDDEPISSSEAVVNVVHAGDSSKATAEKCISALPLKRMTDAQRRQAESVLSQYSLFRKLPILELSVHHETYQFFAMYPDVAVSIWRAMEISKFQMWQTGPTRYEADTGDGTVGVIDVLCRDTSDVVILCQGVYGSPLLPKSITARALIHLQTEYGHDDEGTPKVTHNCSLFVAFPSNTVETAARLISPISNIVIDRNFREISVFLHMMWLAMSRQPGWVEHMAGQLDGVLEMRKEQLLTCTAKVFVAERRRQGLGLAVEVRAQSPQEAASRQNRATADRRALPTRPGLVPTSANMMN